MISSWMTSTLGRNTRVRLRESMAGCQSGIFPRGCTLSFAIGSCRIHSLPISCDRHVLPISGDRIEVPSDAAITVWSWTMTYVNDCRCVWYNPIMYSSLCSLVSFYTMAKRVWSFWQLKAFVSAHADNAKGWDVSSRASNHSIRSQWKLCYIWHLIYIYSIT